MIHLENHPEHKVCKYETSTIRPYNYISNKSMTLIIADAVGVKTA